MHGRVVDMLYFPLYQGFLPSWLPIWGGEYWVFFRPVFNLADAAISVGVGMSMLFYNRLFVTLPKEEHPLT
jgi:signal peptidase II